MKIQRIMSENPAFAIEGLHERDSNRLSQPKIGVKRTHGFMHSELQYHHQPNVVSQL